MNSTKAKLTETESKIVVARGWGLREMGNILEEVKVLRYKTNTLFKNSFNWKI